MKQFYRQMLRLLRLTRRPRTPEEFGLMFRRFREVLDGNNRALEVITEMGDVLGGDYLFDIQYVRKVYSLLSAHLKDSLLHFSELTEDRYPRLPAVYAGIDEKIWRVIDERSDAVKANVLQLEDITRDMAGAVGGKMANLAELKKNLQLAVPEGFAVTTRASDSFMGHNRVFEKAWGASGNGLRSPLSPEEMSELILQGEIPPEVHLDLERAVQQIKARSGGNCFLAVRSSASEEDGDFSFAGLYRTVLNVPAEINALENAYRKVLASLFSEEAQAYLVHLGYDPAKIKMAVGCMVMVYAAASGVLYTSDPAGARDIAVIGASWGLGSSVVDGGTGADHLRVKKASGGKVVEERIGEKAVMTVRLPESGTKEVPTPEDKRHQPCLGDDQLARLIRTGQEIEGHFRAPQDVEWAIDGSGALFILQSRPLRMQLREGPETAEPVPLQRIEFKHEGIVVRKGAATGRVYLLRNVNELDDLPRGAVLVVRNDASNIVRVMPSLAAIVTDTGAATSHMAALSREFRVPTIVNTGDATKRLVHGQEVTVVASDNGAAVYSGWISRLVTSDADDFLRMEDLYEFRKKRYLLRFIAPLNLVDPLREAFTPEACRTLHDLLRFMHEKSMECLIDGAGAGASSRGAVKLDLSIPAGITVIDIGGGLENRSGGGRVTPEQILSVPFRAVVEGMTHPGLWRSEAVPLTTGDFLSSMLHAPDIVSESARSTDINVAVISREYAHVSLKFGYHYAVLDSYVSDTPRNNHIYFRFAGGATDITKRSRRLQFITIVLEEYGFAIETRGDLLIARIANIRPAEIETILERIGRLLSYTRQMDAILQDDRSVAVHAEHFLNRAP